MSGTTLQLAPALQQYLHDVSLREPGPCRELRERLQARDDADLMSSPEQVQLLALLAQLAGAWRFLEVGTYGGYTPLWLALAIPEARFVCLENDPEMAETARTAWDAAGVGERVELRVEDARDSLANLLDEARANDFDLAYIDADKENLSDYYEQCLKLVRPGGLVAVDNTLWKGRVADADDATASTRAVKAFNEKVYADDRVDLSLVPIGDGLTLVRKRESGEA